jgi:hypothetical protein
MIESKIAVVHFGPDGRFPRGEPLGGKASALIRSACQSQE